jgi:hypothetical protein
LLGGGVDTPTVELGSLNANGDRSFAGS